MTPEEFVKKYGGRYKHYKGGWLIQCPFGTHPDNSPSFSLSIHGLFHCWSCGVKGNYTRLLHDIGQLSWKRSIEIVSLLNLRQEWSKQKQRVYEQNESPTISEAVLGLYDVDWKDAYELYESHGGNDADRRPPWALVFDKGFKPATLRHFQAGYDTEDQRITIPIWNERNKLLGILGRACRQNSFKYVPYLNFNYTDHVYNLQATDVGDPVVLVEGAFDAWMLWQWEIPLTAVATMSSHISLRQVSQILEKHANIYLFYDNDKAGWKGATTAAKLLTRQGGRVDIIRASKGVVNIKDMDAESFMKQFRKRRGYPCSIP